MKLRIALLAVGTAMLAGACRGEQGTAARITTDRQRPWVVTAATDSSWLARNDSLRRRAWSFAEDDSATAIAGQLGLYVAGLRRILAEAQTNMEGLKAPDVHCLSIGSLGKLRQPPRELLEAMADMGGPYVDVKQCAIDPALGVWDMVSGRRAWLLWVQPGSAQASGSATVQGGYHAEALMAAEWACSLSLTLDSWRGSECRLLWVS